MSLTIGSLYEPWSIEKVESDLTSQTKGVKASTLRVASEDKPVCWLNSAYISGLRVAVIRPYLVLEDGPVCPMEVTGHLMHVE